MGDVVKFKKITIAHRQYRFKDVPLEESNLLEVVEKKINTLLQQLKEETEVIDKQDLVTMVAIEVMFELLWQNEQNAIRTQRLALLTNKLKKRLST